MLTATKIRIYPTEFQQQVLCGQFGSVRWAWNRALEMKQRLWKDKKENASCFFLIKQLPVWKKEFPWLKDADSQALQQSLRNLDRAFQRFFEKKGNFPRLKVKRSKQSIQYPQRVALKEKQIY